MGEDLWSIHLYENIHKMHSQKFVIDDLRFDHELTFLRNNFKKVKTIHIDREMDKEKDLHPSEQGLSLPPDYTISNDGTIEDLINKVRTLPITKHYL